MSGVPSSSLLLTAVVVSSATAASVTTLAWPGAFPDPSHALPGNSVLAEARGWSAATLLVAVPLSIASVRAAHLGSLRGRLIWLGALVYFVYTYLEFAVCPPFTPLYLLYILAFACAIPALIIGATSVDLAELSVVFDDLVPRRTIAVALLLIAALLAFAWLKGILALSLAGDFGWPQGADAVGHVVHALDLGLQVPLGIAGAVLLLRRRAAGILVGAIASVNGACMAAALTAMVLWSSFDAGSSPWIAAPFALFWLVETALAVAFFRFDVDVGRGTLPRSAT